MTGVDLGFFGLSASIAGAGGAALPPPPRGGTRLTSKATLAPVPACGFPLGRRSPFKVFSTSASAPTRTSLVLARVRVEARRRDDGRSGAEIDIGDPNEDDEVDEVEIVDLRTPEYRFEVRVDELGVDGESLLQSDGWRVCTGRRYGWCKRRSWR